MFKKIPTRTKKLSLTPMIDMVFLLLIFFMLTTSFQRHDGMELNFGEPGEPAGGAGESKLLRVTATEEGTLVLEQTPYEPSRFRDKLREQMLANPDSRILLSSTGEATVQDLIRALDLIRLGGGKSVTVVESP